MGIDMKSFLLLGILWMLIWKGVALWKAGRNYQKIWFVVLYISQTLGALEIIYIIFFQKDKNLKRK